MIVGRIVCVLSCL